MAPNNDDEGESPEQYEQVRLPLLLSSNPGPPYLTDISPANDRLNVATESRSVGTRQKHGAPAGGWPAELSDTPICVWFAGGRLDADRYVPCVGLCVLRLGGFRLRFVFGVRWG